MIELDSMDKSVAICKHGNAVFVESAKLLVAYDVITAMLVD